jgi:ABC-type bacteriocin/lantibiotic exporter with double-glycine peptidase domain
MIMSQTDDLRLQVLELVRSCANLDDDPRKLERVRAYIFSTTVTESTILEVAIEALAEAGIVARVTSSGDRRALEVLGTNTSFMGSASEHRKIRGNDVEHEQMMKRAHVWPAIKKIIELERRDLWFVALYAGVSSVLGLVVPLSSQAIVNSVALGVFSQQLVVLCVVVFVAMLALAGFAVLERYILDLIQRRLFARSAFDIVYRLPSIQRKALSGTYAPELVNRFFDIITVQKSIGKFILDGVNGVLVLFTGLVLLGLYHPIFLLYDLLFLLFVPVLVFILGRNALTTAVEVSKRKYEAAAWLEDVARSQLAFKVIGATTYAFDKMDDIIGRYVGAKHRHYLVVARQILGSYVFKAMATVGVLALGGSLVIQQQISLGQLVAAEIVIILIIGALEKLIGQFDAYYDLVAALDKLSAISDQPLESIGGDRIAFDRPITLEMQGVDLRFGSRTVLRDLDLKIDGGEHVALVGRSGSGKSTIMLLLAGVHLADKGVIRIDGRDSRELDLSTYRRHVGYVFPEDQIFEGTVKDNILLGRDIGHNDLDWALDMTGLTEDVQMLHDGVNSCPEARPFPSG